MIAHISPASVAFEESRNTLTYADRAKSIRTRVSSECVMSDNMEKLPLLLFSDNNLSFACELPRKVHLFTSFSY